MKSLKVRIQYWTKEECEQALELEKAINCCCHIPKEVEIVRVPTKR